MQGEETQEEQGWHLAEVTLSEQQHMVSQQHENTRHLEVPKPLLTVCSVSTCVGLFLAGCQMPTKVTLSLLSSTGQGEEKIMKGSWVEDRERSLIGYYDWQKKD